MRTEGEELRLTAAPLASVSAAASAPAATRAGRWRWLPRWCLAVLPLVFLWGALINQLRVEWEVNPQYAHGWIVPLLCLSLIFGRWEKLTNARDDGNPNDEIPGQAARSWIFACLAILAFLWLPTRLVQEANPEWRMISWVMAVEVICLTLGVIWLQKGRRAALTMAFPFCFFLVAVPWPTLIEGPLIQLLTRICAAFTIEIAGWMDIPAVQHGNIIELATGSLGIDEACSGIRSFQSTLMISLFLGDFYGLALIRRIVLVPVGFALALAFNICRTSFLTYVAGRQGVPAVAKYHDPVGMTIMIACLVAMWLLILLFRGRSSTPPPPPKPIRLGLFHRPSAALERLAVGLGIWLALSEAAVALWYGAHEWGVPLSQSWTVDWPRNNLTYVEKPISEKTKTLLRYDEAVTAVWKEDDATQWTVTYLRWLPGRIAVHLAKVHTPDVCLTAVGNSVEALPDISYLTVRGLRMPFREYILTQGAQPAYVFYCLWEDRAESQFFKTEYLTYDNRLAPVLAGRRNCGQRSIEIVVQGCNDLKGAENALVQELNKVLKVGQTSAKPAA